MGNFNINDRIDYHFISLLEILYLKNLIVKPKTDSEQNLLVELLDRMEIFTLSRVKMN